MENNRENGADISAVRLRALEPEDVDRLYLWENDREVWPFGNTRAPLSRHQIWEYANNYDANPFAVGQLRLIIEADEACGTVDLYDIDPVNSRTMVGIMVAPGKRRNGIAAKALEEVEHYCHAILGLRTIAAEVPADNTPSLNLFGQKAGYLRAGERPEWYRRHPGGYVAAILFQKRLDDR